MLPLSASGHGYVREEFLEGIDVTERRASLNAAVTVVRRRDSVDVVGSYGSGRSMFLRRLMDALRDEDWRVVFVSGIASLKQYPLAALSLPGVVGPGFESRGASSLHEVSAAMQALVKGPRSVIVVDDWDDLDEMSWGVIDAIQRTQGVPVVLARLSGAGPAPTAPRYVVELRPLHIDELEAALRLHLDAPIEKRTLNRIYAMTGGHIGIAVALADAARLESRLTRDDHGVWLAVGDLWSPSLRPVIDTLLADLSDWARDSLQILCSVGAVDVTTAKNLVDADMLAFLEDRGLIAVHQGSNRDLITVVPTLLVDYFQQGLGGIRRGRLRERIDVLVGDDGPVTALSSRTGLSASVTKGGEALFAGLMTEHLRKRIDVAAAQWESAPTPRNAIQYVSVLVLSQSATVDATVEDVFRRTDVSKSDMASRAELITLHADWLAHVQSRIPEAIALLRAERPLLGVFGRLCDAAEVTLLANLVGAPEDSKERLRIVGGLPLEVQLALLEAQMLILVTSCRFGDAQLVFEKISALDPAEERVAPRLLYGIGLLGEGRHGEALRLLTSLFDRALRELDTQRLRALSCGLALCHSHSGDNEALDDLAHLVLAVGGPVLLPSSAQVNLLTVTASVVAARRGDVLLVQRYVAEARSSRLADGPLPAQSLAWPVAQLLILDGKSEEASDELWASSKALWDRRAYSAAILGMFVSIEIHPDRDRLREVQALLELIPENVAAQVQGTYVAALVEQDAEALIVIAEELASTGRFGLAVAACEQAENLFDGAGELDRAEAARRLSAQTATRFRNSLDVSRFASRKSPLTDREEQVAMLASEGLTNKEIAARLFLSTRTVDSHMLRILRKLKVSNRRALEGYFKTR